MKKIYTIIALLTLSVSANAQNQNRTLNRVHRSINNPINTVLTSTSTVLQPASFLATSACTVTSYNVGADGYIAGTNGYGDVANAQKYDLATYGLTLPATSSAVAMLIPYVTGTGSVTAQIYDNNAGLPGTLLGTSMPVGLASINTASYTTFVFATAVNLTSSVFHVALDFSTTDPSAGDTVVVALTDDGCADNTVDGASEQIFDNSWISFTTPLPDGWEFASTDLAIFPYVTAEMLVTGIKSQNVSLASISPNPSNGLFNVKIANNEAVSLTITNAIGQTVIAKNFNSNEAVFFDLSNQNNGVYFVAITNGNDKMIKKVVLNK